MSAAAAKFSEAEISPSIIPVGPSEFLTIQYPGKPPIEFNQNCNTLDTKHAPAITFAPVHGNYYLLVMIDPDSLSREKPTEAEWLQWLVVNIPSDTLVKGTMPKASTGYTGPSPMPRTGDHRYTFLLFDQGKRKITQPAVKSRGKFKVAQFAEKHGLGAPVAGNMFISRHGELT